MDELTITNEMSVEAVISQIEHKDFSYARKICEMAKKGDKSALELEIEINQAIVEGLRSGRFNTDIVLVTVDGHTVPSDTTVKEITDGCDKIWVEDDSPTWDKTTAPEVWKFLFETNLYEAAKSPDVVKNDFGDCTFYTFPNGFIYLCACDGAVIYAPKDAEYKDIPASLRY